MTSSETLESILALRKAELHLHLEGSVEPETVLELDPSLDLDAVRSRYATKTFDEFIQAYIWISRILKTPADYALITRRLLERLAAENVSYAEINLSVGVILWKEQHFDAIFRAAAYEALQSTVKVRWIFDAVRQFGPEHGMRVAELAAQFREHGVVAFGIGGDEARGPAEQFREVFAFAQHQGLKLAPHAGETVGAESVWAAVRNGADRIGHGIRAFEDPELMQYLRDHDIPLEICITSNLCTGAVQSHADHPVRRLYDAGVPIVLSTDDPALFRTTLCQEYRIAAEHFGFSREELERIASNSFRYAFDL